MTMHKLKPKSKCILHMLILFSAVTSLAIVLLKVKMPFAETGDQATGEMLQAVRQRNTTVNFLRSQENHEDIITISNGTGGIGWTEGEGSFKLCTNLSPGLRCNFISAAGPEVWTQSHAVIFRPFFRVRSYNTYANIRPPGQKWIFYEHESPFRSWTPRKFKKEIWKHFNISVAFTKDADITFNMWAIECEINNRTVQSVINFGKEKTGDVLWLESNCNHTSGRELYVQELKKHIQVDIYGKCGKPVCPRGPSCVCPMCSKYRFYLAFENSFCEEYYTEKIGKVQKFNIIPVVMGLVDYKTLLKPGTFIDVRDFSSPKALAEYLRYLSTNHTAYNQYIEQKQQVDCHRKYEDNYFPCKVCEYLHVHKHEKQELDASVFWDSHKRCQGPKQFFKGIFDSVSPNLNSRYMLI